MTIASTPFCTDVATFLATRLKQTARPSCGQSPLEHALGVAAVVQKDLGIDDLPTITVALLHDILEDSDVTLRELYSRFGPEIASDVALLTKPAVKTGNIKALYLQRICTARDRVKVVKIADLLHNFRRRRGTDREDSTRRGIRKFLKHLADTPQTATVRRAAQMLVAACAMR